MGPAMFCLALRPGLKRLRTEFGGEGAETFAYMGASPVGATANMIRVLSASYYDDPLSKVLILHENDKNASCIILFSRFRRCFTIQ